MYSTFGTAAAVQSASSIMHRFQHHGTHVPGIRYAAYATSKLGTLSHSIVVE